MSNKKHEHWCDEYHDTKETHSEIEELAKEIYKDAEKWLLNDINKMLETECVKESALFKNHVLRKCYHVLDNLELLVGEVLDANSVYALYTCDYKYRREHWLTARGLCFKVNAQLNSIVSTVVKKTNIRKYSQLAGKTYKLANKIKNNMIADDVTRKEHCRRYEEDEILEKSKRK